MDALDRLGGNKKIDNDEQRERVAHAARERARLGADHDAAVAAQKRAEMERSRLETTKRNAEEAEADAPPPPLADEASTPRLAMHCTAACGTDS